jgi:hypothetical protein
MSLKNFNDLFILGHPTYSHTIPKCCKEDQIFFLNFTMICTKSYVLIWSWGGKMAIRLFMETENQHETLQQK